MMKSDGSADHFLFHELIERSRKPVAVIITDSDEVTYLKEWHRQRYVKKVLLTKS